MPRPSLRRRLAAVGLADYSPASEADIAAWWDYSDLSTQTITSGEITTIVDKTGNGINLSKVSGRDGPQSVAGPNGLSVGRYAGNEALFGGDQLDNIIAGTDSQFSFIALSTVSNGANEILCAKYAPSADGNQKQWAVLWNGSRNTFIGSFDVSGNNQRFTQQNVDQGSIGDWHLLSATYDGSIDTSFEDRLVMRNNGVDQTLVNTFTNGSLLDIIDTNALIGHGAFSSLNANPPANPYNGDIAEIIMLANTQSTTVLERLEAYYNAKWAF